MSASGCSVSPARLAILTGAALLCLGIAAPAVAGDFNAQAATCATYGPDYAAIEGGTDCVRIGGHVRVQLGNNAGLTGSNWPAGHAAPATLRSDAPSSDASLSGAPTHLRIHGGLEYPSPFQ